MSAQSAAPELTLEVEQVALQRAFIRYAEATGKRLGDVVKQNSRLIAWNLAHNTQPWGMDLAGKKAGEAAVLRDIGNVYSSAASMYKQLLDAGDAKLAKSWYKLVKSGDYKKAADILRKTTLKDRNTPISAPLDPALHQAARTRSRGIVTRHRPAQIVPDGKEIRDYGKQRKALVGFGKAGWITAGAGLGSITRVPAWITRHKGQAPGHADDHTSSRTDPYVVLTNGVNYATKIIPDHQAGAALKIQADKMLAHIEHVLVSSASEAGFDSHATAPATALPMAP
jgi:hypothetical protein